MQHACKQRPPAPPFRASNHRHPCPTHTHTQARQLALLAPFLPTRKPVLPPATYELILNALLLAPDNHALLLELLQAWPNNIYSPTAAIDAIAQRMKRPGGETRELWCALAHLYRGQGRPDLSLAIYLQLQLPSVFEFIQVGTGAYV